MADTTEAKERLARTIAALEYGDYSKSLGSAQEGVPWGLAYAVAVQKEAVGKGRAVRGLGRPKQGQHPGPSGLLKHRSSSPSKGDSGGQPVFDPFGRTAARLNNPVEASWRCTVSATITDPLPLVVPGSAPAAGGGGRAALAPLPPKPSSATPAGAVASAVTASASGASPSMSSNSPPSMAISSVRRPVKSKELMQTVSSNLGWGGSPMRLREVPEAFWKTVSPDVHSEIAEYLFEQDYDPGKYISTQLQELHARRGTQLHRNAADGALTGSRITDSRDPDSLPLSMVEAEAPPPQPRVPSPVPLTPPATGTSFTSTRSAATAGGSGGDGGRTHSGLASSASSVVSIGGGGGGGGSGGGLESLHRSEQSFEGGNSNGNGDGYSSGGGARSELVAAAAAVAPVMMSKYEEQQTLRSTVALSAVLTADQTGMLGMGEIHRGVGARALSRWFHPDGTFKWKLCTVTAASDDGTAFIIVWDHIRKTKTVSRFNILFEGESEDGLTELRQAALEHQHRLQQQLQFNAARDSVPLSAAPLLTDAMLEGIVRRLGLDYWDMLPSAAGTTEGSGGGGAAGDSGSRIGTSETDPAAAAAKRLSAVNASGWVGDGDDYGGGEFSGDDDGGGGSDGTVVTRGNSRNASIASRVSRMSRVVNTLTRAQLQGTCLQSLGTPLRGGIGGYSEPDGAAAAITSAATVNAGNGEASRSSSRGSPSRLLNVAQSVSGAGMKRPAAGPPPGMRPALRRRLLQWRYVHRAWRRKTTEEPVVRIQERLQEARVEYAIAHNRHVFRVTFGRVFGSSGMPDNVEELLMDISRTANTDEDDGGLLVVHRPLLQSGRRLSSTELHPLTSSDGGGGGGGQGPAATSVLRPCMAAFEEPGDGMPHPGVTSYGVMTLSEISLLSAKPTLRALQQAATYLVNLQSRDLFGMQLLPLRHVFSLLAGRDMTAAEHQSYIESRRRPTPAATSGSALGAMAFQSRSFQSDDSIDLVTFLNIQEGVRVEEVHDIRTRVCQQLAYIIADAADEALQSAVAAAAAAAVAAIERANGRLRSNSGGGGSQGPPWQRPPVPSLGSPSAMSVGKSGGGCSGARHYQPPPPLPATSQHAAAQAAFDPVPFFRLTSTINVALFYSIRIWMLQNLRTYTASIELYGFGGVDMHLYDGVPTEVSPAAALTGRPGSPSYSDYSSVSATDADAGGGGAESKSKSPVSVAPHSLQSAYEKRRLSLLANPGDVRSGNGNSGGGGGDRNAANSPPPPSPSTSAWSASGRGHACAPLFHVTLGVVDGEVQFSPPLETLCQRLVDSVMLAVEAVNTLPGLEISLRQTYREAYPGAAKGAGAAAAAAAMAAATAAAAAAAATAAVANGGVQSPEAAAIAATPLLVPFEVTATLKMPPILNASQPEVAQALRMIEEVAESSRRRCETLLMSFQEHTSLLAADTIMLRSRLSVNRRAAVMQDWIDMIERFSAQEEAIRRDMPSEAWLGLVRLDCRGLKEALAARARELRAQILHWLQSDATDAANTTLVRLKDPADILATGAVDLAALHAVRELLPRVASLVSEVQPYIATMRVNLSIMEKFKHPLPDADLSDMWTALRLPVVAHELATERLMHMRDNEERCLDQLKRDLDVFSDHVATLRKRVNERQRLADESQVDKYVEQSSKLDAELIAAIERSQALNRMQALAGWELTNYEGLSSLRRQLQPFTDLWRLVQGFREMYQQWMYSPLFGFDLDVLETRVPGWSRLVAKLDRELKGPPHQVARKYHKRISDFEAFAPLIRALRTNGLRQRHWARLFEEVPALARMDRDIWTLHSLLALRVHEQLVLVRDLADMAARELTIEQSLDKIDSGFHALQLILMPVPESGYNDVVTLLNGEDLLRFVDDAQLRVRGLATSFYVGPHRDSVSAWDEMLSNVRTILDGWLEVQNRWNHIAPLFGAQAFEEQLPDEGARFEEVTIEWRVVQTLVRKHCKVSELTRHTNLAAQLGTLSRKLEGVARGVMEYLDVKRAGFPRFYFLGNLEMVEMMVGSHDPAAVEPFLPKCFPGVRKVGCVRVMPPRGRRSGTMSDMYSDAMTRSGTGDPWVNVTGGGSRLDSQEYADADGDRNFMPQPPAVAMAPTSMPPPPGGLPGLAAFLPGYGLALVGDAANRRVWGGPRLESLISNEGEVLPLRTVVELQDPRTGKKTDVEVWMSELERQMRGSLKEMLRFALEATSLQPFSAWLLAWPAQCLLGCTSINWCRDIHDIYQAGPPFSTPLRRLEELHRSQIHTVVDLLLGGTLSPLQRGIMENMILTKVYHNEVTARLRERRLENDLDFEWLKVLRFYLEGPDCVAHCGYTTYPYGYEYLGNSSRLVITPLTERAFSSMMAAVHLHYGGAPEGPAGTGKTETVKELAKCLGKQCVVFNTTEQLESGHLTRLLMGIISTGAWACFDEFNRMDMEVLSVVAKQIMVIQTALAAGQRYTVFEGRTMYINSSLAMFVTMNPMYEHRSVLPSNLKSLFRPVAMMVPDYTMIAEVSLYAAGFQSAQMLATKIVSCLKIAADRLSAQQHYDFQMRTLKSVLVIAAQLRSEQALAAARAKAAATAAANQQPHQQQQQRFPQSAATTSGGGLPNLSSPSTLFPTPSSVTLPSASQNQSATLLGPPQPLSHSMFSNSSVQVPTEAHDLTSPGVSSMISVASSSVLSRPGGRQNHTVGRLSLEEEAALCKVALLRCNMSKLQHDDVPIFTSMIEREFPQNIPPDVLHATIDRYLHEAAELVGKRATPELVLRARQLHDMLSIRTGILLLGPAACGKTSCWAILQMALSRVDVEAGGMPVSAFDIFPKAVHYTHLYGAYNTTHQHWADGILTSALRQACSRNINLLASGGNGGGGAAAAGGGGGGGGAAGGAGGGGGAANAALTSSGGVAIPGGRAWLVLDGPVDTRWVEGLNPVLDDNRTLCLSSGEMMPLREGVSLLLETDSIAHASPATVSRCGVVYMSAPLDLWRSVLDCWLERLSPRISEYRGKMRATIVSVFPDLLRAYQDSSDQDTGAPRHQPTTIMCAIVKLMDALVQQHCLSRRTEAGDRQLQARLEAAMLFSTAWAFEPSLHPKSRPFFNILLRQLSARSISYEVEHNGIVTETRSMGFHISLPTEGSVFDYMFDFTGLKWISWHNHLRTLSDWSKLSLMPGAFIPFGFRNLVDSHNANTTTAVVPGVVPGMPGSGSMGGSVSGGGGMGGGKAFILTADNLPAIYLLRTLLTARCNVLMSGPTGVGKTSLLHALLHSAKDWMDRSVRHGADDEEETPPIDANAGGGGTASGAAASVDDDGAATASVHGGDDAASRYTDMESIHDDASQVLGTDDLSGGAAAGASSTAAAAAAVAAAAAATPRQTSSAPQVDPDSASPLDVLYLTLSSQSSARGIKRMLEGLLTRRRRNVLGPPLGKTAVLWVDDVNAAGRDMFDTQPAVEVLRQWSISSCWHEEDSTRNKEVVETVLLATITTSQHSKPCPRRFLSQLMMVAMPTISHMGFHAIFTDMVTKLMTSNTTLPFALIDLLVEATLDLYRKVTAELLPSPSRPHYVFSILHVSQVFQSIFHATRPSRSTPELMVRVWQHECMRVFYDRLTEQQHRKWLVETLQEVSTHFLSGYCPPGQPDPSEILLCTFATSNGGYELAEHVLRKPYGDVNITDSILDGEASIEIAEPLPPPGGAAATAAAASTNSFSGGGLFSEPTSPDMATRDAGGTGDATGAGGGGGGGLPQMSTDRALEALYTHQQAAPWVDDGRPMRSVVEERLLEVAQEFADQLSGGRVLGKEHIFVFRNALMHLTRISRVLSMDMGHLTMLGPPGCGRRTLAKLASYICRCTLLEAKLKDEQKGFAWRDLIKSALQSAGVQGRPVTVLLVDLGRPCACMLDDVDQLMSTGSLPDLFKPEEVASITQQLKPVARAAGLTWTDFDRMGGTSDNVLRQFFMERCRANLHFVLILESDPASLQRKVVAFPKLFQAISVNTVDEWDCDARIHVAERFLVSPESLAVDLDSWNRVLSCAVDMHGVLRPHVTRHNSKAGYNTPFMATACHFLRLLKLLRSMVPHRRQVVLTARLKYQQGVSKMTDMQDKLSTLRGQIASMGPELERSRAEVEALMSLIQRQKAEAEAALQRFVPAEASAKSAVAECEALRAACDAALRDVLPPLQAALRELRRIDKSSIAELKVMRNPPVGVKLVLRCLCIMLGRIPPLVVAAEARAAQHRDLSPNRSNHRRSRSLSPGGTTYDPNGGGGGGTREDETPAISEAWWAESTKLLADFHFLDMLLGYDREGMTPDIAAQVEGFVANPMFDPAVMQRTSQAAATICKWVKAMDAFNKGRKLVDPARAALEEAEARLRVQEERLHDNHRKLTAMQMRIVELESKLEQAQATRERLDADMEVAQRKSEQAQLTIAAVVREVGRWQENAELQDKRHAEVLGEVLLSAAHIAYLGPVTGSIRMNVEVDWQEILRTAGVVGPRPFRLCDVLASTSQQDTWRDSGLPHSRTALENAGIMAACGSWVLLHDPQELGHRFIKGFYGGDLWLQGIGGRPVVTFVVLDQSDLQYTSQLFRAIESGSTVLLENFDEDMDDITEQLLACRLVGDTRGAVAIRLGDNLIPYHKDFQLFATTRLRSPRFPSDVLRNVTVVNFSITRAQLCELLITATLRFEMPDLEHEHLVLTRQKAKGEADLMELEDQVLQAITATSTEELLEESEVYQLLKNLQESTDAIKAKVARIEASQKAINLVRADTEKYFVARVTPFFFCLSDLANLRHTYQFGLHWFMRLFNDALVTCLKANSGKARLASLTMHFTTMFYANVSRSLFDEDKLPFAILLMVRFLEASGLATKDEANLLLYGRATDSTYTAKPTFMRLASGRAGLGRAGQRRGGGGGSGGSMNQQGIGTGRSGDTSISGLASGGGAGGSSGGGAARRSNLRGGSSLGMGSSGGGSSAGGGGVPPAWFSGGGTGSTRVLQVWPEEIRPSGEGAEEEYVAVTLDGTGVDSYHDNLLEGVGANADAAAMRSIAATSPSGAISHQISGVTEAVAAAAIAPEISFAVADDVSTATTMGLATLEGNPFGGMFLSRREGGGGGGGPLEADGGDATEAQLDAADAAFYAAVAVSATDVLVPTTPLSGDVGETGGDGGETGGVGVIVPQRLSGLLPNLLSTDASAPAYLPDDLRPDWMPEESWSRLKDLGKLQPYNRVLPTVFDSLQGVELLHKYYDNLSSLESPDLTHSPPWHPALLEPVHPHLRELSTFQRLLLVRCLQPRGFVAQAQEAVHEYLGASCVANEQLVDFEAIFAITESTMPIVLISSTDHTLPFLQQFADSRGISVMHMAIGRGQGAATDRLIRSAVSMDRWVILENSHLAGDWMPSLCRLVQALPLLKPHQNFRLWLTTVPTSAYPDIILQSSLKLVMDPPHGIKANLLQVMSQLPVEVASNSRYATQLLPSYGADSGGEAKDDTIGRKVTILPCDWKQLLLRLCLFHAMLAERLQYRSLGWRRPYEFTAADMLSAINQVISIIHAQPTADLDGTLPGLLHVVGQCLYGGKVTHDWDRRLLVCLLSQQLQPSDVAAAATLETLLPERLSSCTQDLSVVAKDLRLLPIPREDPTLVGLCPGAAAIRAFQYTRHVLDTLKRVHLLRSNDDVDLTKPLQLALSVCQDLLKQLPLTPIPGTRSGWAALVGPSSGRSAGGSGYIGGGGGSSGGGTKPASARSSRSTSPWAAISTPGVSVSSGGGGGHSLALKSSASQSPSLKQSPSQQPLEGAAAAAAAAEVATREQLYRAVAMVNTGYLPRYKAGKMTEDMSQAARERWDAMHPTIQKAMVQVFNDEVASFAAMLNTVHGSIRAVNAAIKGYEGVTEGVEELVQQLSKGHVPRAWLHQRVELQSDNIATWLSDLHCRLEFLYDWAVDGPPVAVPLGMLSRPRSFLTAVQQSFAERMGRPVGQVFLDSVLLQEHEDQALPRHRLSQLGTKALASTMLTSSVDSSTISLGTALSEGCLLSGMLLQGAKWDRTRRVLTDAALGVLHSAMPLLWLRATATPAVPQLARALALPGATVPTRINDSYVCPVFKFVAGFGGRNTNLLQGDADDCMTTVLLPCGTRKAEYWAAHNVVVVSVPDSGGMTDMTGGLSTMASTRESTAGIAWQVAAGGGKGVGGSPAW